MIEFVITLAVGLLIYLVYVVPVDGFEWHYVAVTFGIAAMALLAFQAADVYQVQAFRGYDKQYFRLAIAWSVVFLLVIGRDLLRQGRRRVLPGVAGNFLRRRPPRADRIPARAVSARAPLDRTRAASPGAP